MAQDKYTVGGSKINKQKGHELILTIWEMWKSGETNTPHPTQVLSAILRMTRLSGQQGWGRNSSSTPKQLRYSLHEEEGLTGGATGTSITQSTPPVPPVHACTGQSKVPAIRCRQPLGSSSSASIWYSARIPDVKVVLCLAQPIGRRQTAQKTKLPVPV